MATEKLNRAKKRKTVEEENHQASKRVRESCSSPSDLDDDLAPGKIKRIFMKNFMCHDAMEVNFNPRVNFIVGANGSGKSAILTALTVGLGAKAKDTKRGPSIKEFIKKGKSSAMIEITISNNGAMAYKYEVYGDSITVVRNIGESTSSYKIKNWRGEVISTRRDELDNVIDCLNIQVDNPISVLNQDVSRTFLVTSGPAEKYRLFMKATRLEKIGKNYKEASLASESTRESLDEAQKFLADNEKEISKLRKKFKALESLDQTRQEYQDLKDELLWAAVVEEEKKLLQVDVNINEQQQNMDKLKELEHNKAAKEQEIDSKIEDLKKEIAQHEVEASESNTKLNEIKKRYAEAKQVHNEKKEKVRAIHEMRKRKEQDITTLQTEIKKLEQDSAANDRRQQAKQELSECEQQLDEVEATLRTKQTDSMHLEENKRRVEQEQHTVRINLDQKRSALTKLKQRLSAFINQPNDALTVYGPNMPRLLKRIEEAHSRGKFRHKPLGPLGSFIKLKDSSWIPAIENHLGFGTLASFCVDNGQDGHVLDIIMKEVFRGERSPTVVISKFFDRMHDVREGCTNSPQFPNLLDMMEISHPVIANSLIDQREIECILLIPTSSEASVVMSDANKVPRNCKQAITKNADIFFPDPNYRTYGGSVNRPKFLQVSTSEAVQSLREEIGVTEDELRIIEQEFSDIRERMRNNQVELQQTLQQTSSLTRRQMQLRRRIEELKEVIESYNNNTINTFMIEIEELQRLVVQKKEEESHMAEDMRQSLKNLEALGVELKTCRDLAQNLDARLNPIKETIKDLKNEKNRLSVSNQGAARRMEEAKRVMQRLNSEHQQQQRVVNSKIETAERACPRIETRKSTVEINQRARELEYTIKTVEREHGTKDALAQELEEKEGKYEGVKEFAVSLSRSNDKQLKRLKERRSFYNRYKKEITERVQESFKHILVLRNYKGRISIDHQKKELSLEVTPANDIKRSTNDAKALSGGERSYSTVAFILALWNSTGLPFYFLDEFDVFMDKINRRTIMDILLSHAKNHPNSQFAFLTPLDTSHITAENTITIHRLAAPERST